MAAGSHNESGLALLPLALAWLGVPMGRDDGSGPLKRHREFRAKVERHRQHEDEPSPAWEGAQVEYAYPPSVQKPESDGQQPSAQGDNEPLHITCP